MSSKLEPVILNKDGCIYVFDIHTHSEEVWVDITQRLVECVKFLIIHDTTHVKGLNFVQGECGFHMDQLFDLLDIKSIHPLYNSQGYKLT